jgi:O-methyltransferase
MRFPTFGNEVHEAILLHGDYCRYATIGLALQRVLSDGIPGSLAEVGVYKGNMSKHIRRIIPGRTLYLFDTFQGFPVEGSESHEQDNRFRDTDIETVLNNIGDRTNLVIKKGCVPETLHGLDGETFSFVLLDLDKYHPTLASLEFFYSRLAPGGYLIVHDYNSPESNWGCNRALNDFIIGKPEKILEMADRCGSALFRKM